MTDKIIREHGDNFKISGSKMKFTQNKDKDRVEACFQSLQIDNKKFERPTSGKQVHEEKYRILFITKLPFGSDFLTVCF